MTALQRNSIVYNNRFIANSSDGNYCEVTYKEQAFLKRNSLAPPNMT